MLVRRPPQSGPPQSFNPITVREEVVGCNRAKKKKVMKFFPQICLLRTCSLLCVFFMFMVVCLCFFCFCFFFFCMPFILQKCTLSHFFFLIYLFILFFIYIFYLHTCLCIYLQISILFTDLLHLYRLTYPRNPSHQMTNWMLYNYLHQMGKCSSNPPKMPAENPQPAPKWVAKKRINFPMFAL